MAAFDLPADELLELADGSQGPFPHSVVALRQTTSVSPTLVESERVVALSDSQIERLHEAWVRFVALRGISSTGTIAAMVGKRIVDVSTVESSRRRHAVLLTLDDESLVVVYQEPRVSGPHLQPVRVRNGGFEPQLVRVPAGSEVVLRFGNEDTRDWFVSCQELGVTSRRLLAAKTNDLLIKCPDRPLEVALVNDRKRASTLALRAVPGG